MGKFVIEPTSDGSYTLYVPDLEEHYHSTNGAIQESEHVFIKTGLKNFVQKHISILEIGFGTGLNALLTIKNSTDDQIIEYHTFENNPLPPQIIKQLNYTKLIDENLEQIFLSLHNSKWNERVMINENFYLTKIEDDFSALSYPYSQQYDIIYFDAFAPNKQDEMWSQSIFDKLFSLTNNNGVLVTYCAKGSVRRMMQQAGYIVERLPGPPGKREMLRAKKSQAENVF